MTDNHKEAYDLAGDAITAKPANILTDLPGKTRISILRMQLQFIRQAAIRPTKGFDWPMNSSVF